MNVRSIIFPHRIRLVMYTPEYKYFLNEILPLLKDVHYDDIDIKIKNDVKYAIYHLTEEDYKIFIRNFKRINRKLKSLNEI